MFWIAFAVVLAAMFIGARRGGIFLGMAGGMGLAVLVFGLKLPPSSPPIDVMLIIMAVITAAATLQSAGGMDYLVQTAERILRKNPNRITFMAPIVAYCFTLMSVPATSCTASCRLSPKSPMMPGCVRSGPCRFP
jgi:Anaerobic C4-dicarboxylate transporter